MLQDIRQNIQGPAVKIVVWVIVIAFAGFGIESILLGGGGSGVAKVNGEDILPGEVQQTVNTQKRQLIAMMGDNIDPSLLDDQRLEAQAIQSLVNRRLLEQSAADMGLSVSESELGRQVATIEAFQLNGEFSPEVYKGTLAQAGYTPATFKAGLKADLMINQARSGLAGSEFATPSELDLTARIIAEQRDIRYLSVSADSVKSDQPVSDQDVSDYYSANEAAFYSAESVVLDYIELNLEDFFTPPSEEEVQTLYEVEKNAYAYQTESRVSHILLTQRDDEDEAAYQARIAALQSELDGGGDFAQLAGEYSDDFASAEAGGDLGYTSGDAFPPEMETAIAALDLNTVSAPVQTDAGTHFLLVTDRREGGEPPTLESLRPQLERSVQERDARASMLATVEDLRDQAFNASDLAAPAKDLSLTVERSKAIGRDGGEGIFAYPAVISAAFSDDVLEGGHNSEVVELGPEHYVVVHVAEHQPSALKPLEQVRPEIVAAIEADRTRSALTELVDSLVSRLRDGEPAATVAESAGVELKVEPGVERDNTQLPQQVLETAFALPAPSEAGVSADYRFSPAGDAYVVAVDGVTAGKYAQLTTVRKERLEQLLASEYAALVQQEYQQELEAKADIEVY